MEFKKKIEQLEALVETMESADMDLDKICAKYTEGVKIAQSLMQAMKKKEEKLLLIKKEAQKIVLEEWQ